MATKPKPLSIPSAATPEDSNAGAIPLSQYLDPSEVAPPFLSLPAATGPAHAPIPPALLPPEPAPAPQDPNAGAIPLEAPTANEGAIPLTGIPGIYTTEQIKGADTASLVADKNFRPVDWLADNEKNALGDPKLLEKVQDVYTQKLKSDKGALHDLVTLPLHPVKAVKSTIEIAKALAGGVAEVPAVVGRATGYLSRGDLKAAAGEAAAAGQAVSASERRDVNLLLKTLRGAKEAVGLGPETPEDYRKRLFFDLEMKKQENEARAGNGELAQALGVDTPGLKEAGITVNPEAVDKLSIVEDPINFIPVGGAVGAVGRFGKMVVATATTAERAEQLAAVLNNAARVGATKGIEGIGSLVEKVGQAEAAGRALRKAPLGGSLGTAVKGVGLAAELAAKPFRIVGKGIRETAPVTGVIAAEGLKGAAEAAAITFPLTIGATPEEREALLGNIGLAAGLRAGGTAVGLGTRAAANWTRDKVAADLYKSVERAPTQDSLSYGTDPDLDLAHDNQMQNTGSATKNVVNYFREFLRPSGIELYAMDKNDFVKNVDPVGGAAKAKGYYVKRGVRVNPDGTQTPVNQVFLNGSADAIGHELFHAFEDIDPDGAAKLKTDIATEWTPEESKDWKQTYESALNGGKQEKDWTHHLTDDELRSEAAAEVFGRVLDATDLTGVAPTIQKRTARFLSSVLEKIGFPLGGTKQAVGPGVSELGVRASVKQFDAAKDFITNLTGRVNDTGSAIGTPKPAVPLTELVPGEISRKAIPPTPAAPGPAPVPAPIPTVPITVAPKAPVAPQLELGLGPTAPNIRVPAEKQLDFAAKRAAVTNETEAKAAADRVGNPDVQKVVSDINTGINAGQTAFEIEHKGVKSESTPAEPLARTPRRTEQEEAYVAESMGALPEDVRTSHQKVSSFVRWDVLKDGTPQFIGYSLDKAIANIEHLIRWSNEKGVKVPYSATPESWREVVQDLKDYYNNQSNGFRGDGKRFVRPTEDIQVSLPPENPNYSPVQLTTEKVQFLNAAQGLPSPLTVREVKGKIPGNIKAQLLNELQGGKPQAAILPSDIKKREFKTPVGGRKFEIAEVNPLRAAMIKADVPVRELIEVTERLNADDIVSATPRPDIEVKPGVTDIIRGGFLPAGAESNIREEVAKLPPVAPGLVRLFHGEGGPQGGGTGGAFYTSNPEKAATFGPKLSWADVTVEAAMKAFERAKKSRFPGGDTFILDDKNLKLSQQLGAQIQPPTFNLESRFLPASSKFTKGVLKKERWSLKEGKSGEHSIFYQLWDGDKEVGYVQAFQSPGTPHFGEIAALEIFPEYRGRGGAEALLREAANELIDRGVTRVGGDFLNQAPLNLWKKVFGEGVSLGDDIKDFNELEARSRLPKSPPATMAENEGGRTGRVYGTSDLPPGSKFLPSKPVPETISDVLKATPEEWQNFFGPNHALTPAAFELGLGLKSPEDLNALRAAQDKANVEYRELLTKGKAGDRDAMAAAGVAATKSQFFREAIEAATDTGSAAGTYGWRRVFPDAKPPFAGEGKFSPSENRDIAEDFFDRYDREGTKLIEQFQASKPGDQVVWPRISAARLKRIWLDFGKTGVIRDEKGLSNIEDQMLNGVARLRASTELLGHTESSPNDAAERFGLEKLTPELDEELGNFLTDKNGQWMLSDYGLPKLEKLSEQLYRADAPEDKAYVIDKMLNVIHARSDLAEFFVEGGSRTLREISEQGGYEAGEKKFSPSPAPSDDVRTLASVYAKGKGIDYAPKQDYAPLNVPMAKKIAEAYDEAKHNPEDPAVQKSYDALAKETVDQYHSIVNAGYTIEPFEGKGEPYKNSGEMLADVRDNKHLFFFRTEEAYGGEVKGRGDTENLLLRPSGVEINGQELSYNDVFRAVHDFYGHAKEGYTFGPRGEYNAWRAHDELYSPEARGALAAETLGQNAWFNYGKHLRTEAGEVPAKGEAGYKPLTERPFAPQKNTLLSGEILDAARRGESSEPQFDVKRKGEFSPAKRKEDKGLSGWILPDRSFKEVGGISGANHEDYLAANSVALNKKFGTDLSTTAGADERLAAINKGFVRMRAYGGNVSAEIGQKFWNNKVKDDILSRVLDNIDDVNQFRVTLLDEKGKPVDSFSENLFMADDPQEAASRVLNSIRGKRSGSFLPEGGTPEFNDYVKERIRDSKKFPEALPLAFRQDENGNYKAGFNGDPVMVAQSYDFLSTPLAKESKGKTTAETEEKYTSALAKKLTKEYAEAKKNPTVAAGETWYSTTREKLTNLLDDDSKFFAELLGATSSQTSVDVNFGSAVEAYNQFKRGAFDDLIDKYREGKKAFANGELAEFEKETGKSGKKATYDAFMSWWVEKNQLIPTKSNGKRFEMNSRAVMRVLDGSWLQQAKGPKTPNFTGNLTGTTFEATIDVWAARMLHRLSNEGNKKRWRIQSANESGVEDIDFFLGQKAFRKAATAVGLQPDALQAILWFAEKDRWEKNGWTKSVGAKKSDYNTLLSETVKTSEGKLEKVDNQLKLGNL